MEPASFGRVSDKVVDRLGHQPVVSITNNIEHMAFKKRYSLLFHNYMVLAQPFKLMEHEFVLINSLASCIKRR